MSIDYSDKPVIIEGVNHSGTRALVKILSIFGSDGGDYNNQWNENKYFLDLHKKLIDKVSTKGWTETILSLEFIREFHDDQKYRDYIIKDLEKNLDLHYPSRRTKPWHWKCPTSALFENTWTSIYPDGFYIINKRDPMKIALAFKRRGGKASLKFKDGLKFYEIIERRILEVGKKNQIVVDFDNLKTELLNIAKFLPWSITENQIQKAQKIIKSDYKIIRNKESIKSNLKNIYAFLTFKIYDYKRYITSVPL